MAKIAYRKNSVKPPPAALKTFPGHFGPMASISTKVQRQSVEGVPRESLVLRVRSAIDCILYGKHGSFRPSTDMAQF